MCAPLTRRDQQLLDALPQGVAVIATDGIIKYANSYLAEMLGYDLADLQGALIDEVIPFILRGDDKPQPQKNWRAYLSDSAQPVTHELSSRHRGGHLIEIEATLSAFSLDGERQTLCLLRSVDPLTRAHAARPGKRALGFEVVDAIPIPVLVVDSGGRPRFSNSAAKELFEFYKDDQKPPIFATLRATRILRDPRTGAAIPLDQTPLSRALRGEPTHERAVSMELPSGHVPLVVSTAPIFGRDQQVELVVATLRDAREEQRLHTELLKAHKLEAVGRLAAGIAHEINTPSQFVSDNLHFLASGVDALLKFVADLQRAVSGSALSAASLGELQRRHRVDFVLDQIRPAVEQSLEGMEQISSIVAAMRDFSHPDGSEQAVVDLNDLLRNAVTVTRNTWKYVAELKLDLDEEIESQSCFAGEINQVILNLITNASHAIEAVTGSSGLGTITLRTRQDERWSYISVSDTGTGIPEEIRHRIFDPFYTTKAVGQGTGQGLAIVHNVVVVRHGGRVELDSAEGRGTTVTVMLPRFDRQEARSEPAS